MRKSLILLVAWSLLFPVSALAETPGESSADFDTAEGKEPPGETSFILDVPGFGYWPTERDPLPQLVPLQFGLQVAQRKGLARISGRLDCLLSPGGERVVALVGDLLSIERVYRVAHRVRPYWRVSLGFVLDLSGPKRSLGDQGFFNADNGAAGGPALAHGWGVDIFVGESVFVRFEGNARVYGGAGRTGLLLGAQGGVGWVF